MNKTPQKFPTKTMDRALAAMDVLFIPIIQLEMEFDFPLDQHRLAKSVSLLIEAEPILGCKFVCRILRPYWEIVEKEKSDIFTLTKKKSEYDAFKKKGIDFLSAPQILACLYRSESADRLTIKISHLVSDAAGVKDIAATLSTIYNRLKDKPDFHPDPNPCDSRSFGQITKHIPWAVRPRIVFNYLRETIKSVIPYRTHGVPVKNTSENAGKYITMHIEKEELTNMIQYAKKHDATINDVLLAAIFRAYSKMGGWDGKAALRMAMTVDLRRYLPDKKAESISNFSSMEILTYGTAMEDDFDSTLARIVEMVNKRKSSWLGLSAFISLYMALWALPYAGLNLMTKKGWESKANSSNAFDWFTNMGKISAEQVNFGGKPYRALLLPPGCNLPLFFFGCSSYDGSLNLSASIMPDAENEMITNRFFDLIVSELPLR